MLKRLVNEATIHPENRDHRPGAGAIRSRDPGGTGYDAGADVAADDWQVYLPGSSLKGVIRSHVEKVSRSLRDGVICNPFGKPPTEMHFAA